VDRQAGSNCLLRRGCLSANSPKSERYGFEAISSPGVDESLRINRVKVATASGPVEITWATREELIKRLRWLTGAEAIVKAFVAAGTSKPVELDEAGKRRLFDELVFWLGNPGKSPFSDDARALYRALAQEVGGPGRPAGE
jgi:hypothetical protein